MHSVCLVSKSQTAFVPEYCIFSKTFLQQTARNWRKCPSSTGNNLLRIPRLRIPHLQHSSLCVGIHLRCQENFMNMMTFIFYCTMNIKVHLSDPKVPYLLPVSLKQWQANTVAWQQIKSLLSFQISSQYTLALLFTHGKTELQRECHLMWPH